jgi:hypothetical protein
MKSYFITIILFAVSNSSFGQPWKLTKDFSLAFQNSYDNYRLVKISKNNRIYCIAFDKKDTLKRIFEFEMLKDKKDGWFVRIDTTNKDAYNIFFEEGIAKKISFIGPDSSLSRFSLDSNLLNGVHTVYYSNGKIKEYGFYKNNARIGEWRFYNIAGQVTSEGQFVGDYSRLIYDTNKGFLITLNRYLDTVRVELMTQKMYDSLKELLHQNWGLNFPIHLHFKTGLWKYYDDAGKLILTEFYDKGKLINVEKEITK